MKKLIFLAASTLASYSLFGQNVGISSDGSTPEAGVMLDVKGTNAKTTTATQTILQATSFDASATQLKLRFILGTSATAGSRYGAIDVADFAGPAYRNLALQPSGGNLGIGTTSPSQRVHIAANGNAHLVLERAFSNASGNHIYSYKSAGSLASPSAITSGDDLFLFRAYGYSGPIAGQREAARIHFDTEGTIADDRVPGVIRFYTATDAGPSVLTQRMIIKSSGNVGVGANNPTARLHVSGSSGTTLRVVDGNQGAGKLLVSDAAGYATWSTLASTGAVSSTCVTANYVPKMSSATAMACSQIFDNGTNVGIGTASPTYKLHVNGRLKTTGINETSDKRLKKNIVTIAGALKKISSLRGVEFDWRINEYPEMNLGHRHQIGLIAQEVESVLPDLVHTDNSGFKSVEYSKMVAILIEAVKEQQRIIEGLKFEVSGLKSDVSRLQNQETIKAQK